MKDLYQIKLEATNLLINEKASKKSNLLTRKEAYKSLKDDFCIWALKKSANNKYIKVMEIARNDKYIYFRHYGGWSEKMSFENFNFYVNKLQEKNERIYFIAAISYKSIEGKAEEIAKKNNIDYSPYKIY